MINLGIPLDLNEYIGPFFNTVLIDVNKIELPIKKIADKNKINKILNAIIGKLSLMFKYFIN